MPFIDFSEEFVMGSMLSLDITVVSQLEVKTCGVLCMARITVGSSGLRIIKKGEFN